MLNKISSAVLLTAQEEFQNGSFVILDDGSADYISSTSRPFNRLHAFASRNILKSADLGAVSVSSLHTLTPKDIAAAAFLSPHTRLSSTAILISALLGQSEHLLHSICLAAAPYTRRITVFCAHSENAHHDEAPSVYSPSCYSDLAHRLTTTIHAAHNNNTTVAVKFLPMPCIPIGEAAFVFPAACNAAVTACAHGFTLGYSGRDIDDPEDNENEYAGNISSGNPKSEDFLFRKHNVPSAGQEPTHRKGKAPVLNHGVSVVAHALAHLAAELGVRPETFCIGPAAKAVGYINNTHAGHSLSFVPPIKPLRGGPPQSTPAALILIDRSMDVAAAIKHENLLVQRCIDTLRYGSAWGSNTTVNGSATAVLPAVQTLVPMIQVNHADADDDDEMPTASHGDKYHGDRFSSFLPGTILHPTDDHATANFAFLLTRKEKDARLFVRKWLREALRKEGIQSKQKFLPGAGVGAAELSSLCAMLRAAPSTLSKGLLASPLIQLTEAIIQTMDKDADSKWKMIKSSEEALLEACKGGDREGAFGHLMDLCALVTRAHSNNADGGGIVSEQGPSSVTAQMMVGMMDIVTMVFLVYCTVPKYISPRMNKTATTVEVFRQDQEAMLVAALVDALLACCACWARSDSPDECVFEDVEWVPVDLRERLLQLAHDGQRQSTPGSESNETIAAEKRALTLELQDLFQDVLGRMQELSSVSYAARRGNSIHGNTGIRSGLASALTQATRKKTFGQWDSWGDDDSYGGDKLQDHTTDSSRGAAGNDLAEESLVVHVIKSVLDQKPIDGLTQANTSLAGLLKSGLGRLGLQKEHHPGEYGTVMVFVLGGISAVEIHEALACVDAKLAAMAVARMNHDKKEDGWGGQDDQDGQSAGNQIQNIPKIFIGGSALISPKDVVLHSLISSGS